MKQTAARPIRHQHRFPVLCYLDTPPFRDALCHFAGSRDTVLVKGRKWPQDSFGIQTIPSTFAQVAHLSRLCERVIPQTPNIINSADAWADDSAVLPAG